MSATEWRAPGDERLAPAFVASCDNRRYAFGAGAGDRMRRRQFSYLFGALACSSPFAAFGQSKDRPTVGVLGLASEAQSRPYVEGLRDGLGKFGLIDGSTMRLVARYADARPERLADLARELATERSRVIVTSGTTAVNAAHLSAPGLPIVMAGSADPELMGFARSLARPGGRITGISIRGVELLGKQFQLLKEAVPAARTFAAFLHAANPGNPEFRKAFGDISQALGMRIDVRDIHAVEEFPAAFDWAVRQSADGAMVLQDPSFDTHREAIFRLAVERRLPTVTGNARLARAGALLAYALDFVDVWRQSARYVSEILRGADPALLPIEQATAFRVLVNMKTARALGLALPLSLLTRADEVIE
ncbi:ABC transporter substrate-binding protein [Reyranella sp.]|uniref:ABC transporter substrate-binding protein n=1 Tax=Reyranella sp. TaxID=1929291 RepID=UPI003784E311